VSDYAPVTLQVNTAHWTTVANISKWLGDRVPTEVWKGIATYRHFKIIKGDDEQIWYLQ
jgi:hypothetical protein